MIAFGILKDDFYLMAVKRVQGIWDERPETQQEMDEIQEQVPETSSLIILSYYEMDFNCS